MCAHSVKVNLQDGQAIYISPNQGRKLLKDKKAVIVSERPFQLQIRAGAEAEFNECQIQRWTGISRGMLMNGSLLEQKPPRP